MRPLYIDAEACSLGDDNYSLVIKDKAHNTVIEQFKPRDIPYDSILIQRAQGYISFAAINWLVKHAVSLTILDWRGNVLGQFLPEEPISNELKIAQYKAYVDRELHLKIARTLVETKTQRQKELLESLSQNYPSISIPKVEAIRFASSTDFLRNHEARYATAYFTEFGKACLELGYDFQRRNQTKSNKHAADLPNALLNYSYACLQTYAKRALNSIGLDNSIPFLHDMTPSKSLVFDMMELWRSNCDYSVLQTLEQLRRTKNKTYYLTDGFEVVLDSETIKLLFEKLRFNLSLEEIILNCRILANYLLGKRDNLIFNLRTIHVNAIFESEDMKDKVLTKSYRELGMNKSTLWYQKRRLEQTGSLRVYNNTKRYFV